jgi:uncharacterized protein YjbJ (UPF0337 family)
MTGTGDKLKGKAQETMGKVAGNDKDQTEGKATQAKGSGKQAIENVKNAAKHLTDK